MKSGVMIDFEPLESRTLLSGHHGFGGCGGMGGFGQGFWGNYDNPAVQADLEQIRTDREQLQTDRQALQQTIAADRKALYDAINAVDVTALREAAKADFDTWRAVLQADLAAIRQDRNDPAKLAEDRAKFQTDRKLAQAAFQADAEAIQSAIDSDPNVIAARDQLKTDSQPIVDDLAQLQADYAQLFKDLRTILPKVISKTPAANATGIANTTTVTAKFNVSVQSDTVVAGFTLTDSEGNAVSAAVTYDDATRTATLTSTSPLADNTTYTATITGVKDADGNAMAAAATWSFTTGTAAQLATTTKTVTKSVAKTTAKPAKTFSTTKVKPAAVHAKHRRH